MKTLHYISLFFLGIFHGLHMSGQADMIQLQRSSTSQIGVSSTDLIYQLSSTPITQGEILKQQNTPDGRVA